MEVKNIQRFILLRVEISRFIFTNGASWSLLPILDEWLESLDFPPLEKGVRGILS